MNCHASVRRSSVDTSRRFENSADRHGASASEAPGGGATGSASRLTFAVSTRPDTVSSGESCQITVLEVVPDRLGHAERPRRPSAFRPGAHADLARTGRGLSRIVSSR
jgi:hypothetical protein